MHRNGTGIPAEREENDQRNGLPARRPYSPPMNGAPTNENRDQQTHNDENRSPPTRQYSPPLYGAANRTRQDDEGEAPPARHSVLQQRQERAPVGSTYLPQGTLPGRDGVQRHSTAENLTRAPTRLNPIMDPVGAPGTTGPQHTNMLYGPPMPVYETEERDNVAAKAFTAPRFTAFSGTPEEEGQKARHFLGLVEMHAAVTKGVTNSQKILIAVTNMKGAASEWFFTTNDRHAELYGGQPLFNSFQRFKELFLQRFGQMNTANAMAKLEAVKLKKGETVATFAQALENLFYSANLVDEQAKLYYFFRAIGDPLKSQVRGCKPLTLNQAIQDAVHFDQRMSKDEQNRSRFTADPETEDAKPRSRFPAGPRNTVRKAETEDVPSNPKQEQRPLIGKAKAKFPRKYDPIGHAEKKKQEKESDNPHAHITCFKCWEKGHYASTCTNEEAPEKRPRAVTRMAEERDEDPLIDTPEGEPDFEEPALIRILDAHWDATEDEELAPETESQAEFDAHVNVLTGEALPMKLPQKRTPFPIDNDGFVEPVQPSGVDPEPFMALPQPTREEQRQQRRKEAERDRATKQKGQPKAAIIPAPPAAASNSEFPLKWVPTKEIIKHCPPELITGIKQAAKEAVSAQEGGARPAVLQAEAPEHLTIFPSKQRPPLTRVAGRIGGVNGPPHYICIDSGANVGMISEQIAEEAGLKEKIKWGKPTFSTADGKMASGVGWLDTKVALGTKLEITTRFVVARNLDYQVLLGTNALRPLQAIIDFHSRRFRFRLPQSGLWRSLPLVDRPTTERIDLAVARLNDEDLSRYVEHVICELLSGPTPALNETTTTNQSQAGNTTVPTPEEPQAENDGFTASATSQTESNEKEKPQWLPFKAEDDYEGMPPLLPPEIQEYLEKETDNGNLKADKPEEKRNNEVGAAKQVRFSRDNISYDSDELPDLLTDDDDSETEDSIKIRNTKALIRRNGRKHASRHARSSRDDHDYDSDEVPDLVADSDDSEAESDDEGVAATPLSGRKDGRNFKFESQARNTSSTKRPAPEPTQPTGPTSRLSPHSGSTREGHDKTESGGSKHSPNDRQPPAHGSHSQQPTPKTEPPVLAHVAHQDSAHNVLNERPIKPTATEPQSTHERIAEKQIDGEVESDSEDDDEPPELLNPDDYDDEPDFIEADELLNTFNDYEVMHGFDEGVLIQSSVEAKNLLRFLLREQVITKEKASKEAAACARFFSKPTNKELLFPIHRGILPLLPRLYKVQKITGSERVQLNEHLKAHAYMTLQAELERPAVKTIREQLRTATPEQIKEHWEAVKPQLVLGEDLDPGQKQQILELLERHCLVFSKDKSDLGLVEGYFHTIETGDSKPIRLPPHRHSHAEKEEIARQTQPMIEWEVVRRSKSPYAAPVVLARKKDDTWRYCVDFRGLNKVTVPNRYPIPRIDAIFDTLGEAEIFSTVDANSGYWQILIAPEDAHKTAFITHQGLFEFTRMPFGLTGAPGTYQRMMDEILHAEINGEIPIVTQYLDDTCVFTKDWGQHLLALDRILTKFENVNLKLAPKKCVFGTRSAEHLGHVIRKNQLLPDPKKVTAVKEWPQPINVSEVRAFLGLAGYYRHFIKDFSIKAKPLHELTKKEVPFHWDNAQKTAFTALKDTLSSAPVLIRPDFEKPFIIDTDFSYEGIGATISQIGEDGKEHPIAFASKALQAAEKNYSVTDGELLAIVWAVTVKFRPYLYGHHLQFLIRTDHNPLVWLQSQKNLSGRLARWQIKLMEYNFRVEHRPGKVHSNVDPLSRHPDPTQPSQTTDQLDDLPDHVTFPTSGTTTLPRGTATVKYLNDNDAHEPTDPSGLHGYGNERRPSWIGRPRTPPVAPPRYFYQDEPSMRMPRVYPLTFDNLSPDDLAYITSWRDSREPRPTMSNSPDNSPETTRARDGSICEGSSKETQESDDVSPQGTHEQADSNQEEEWLLCREEFAPEDFAEEHKSEEGSDTKEESAADPQTVRMMMEIEPAPQEQEGKENEEERLVEVPPATEREDIERLADLAKGLTPEQVAELSEQAVLMPPAPNMDLHLGWDLEEVLQTFQMTANRGTTGQTVPEINFDEEDLTLQKIHQLKKVLRTMERNDDTEGIAVLKDSTLAERVTLTIMKERPDLNINEVYNNAVEVTTTLRTRAQREIEQAYREMHLQEKLTAQAIVVTPTEEGEQLTLTPQAEKWDLSKIPPPKDSEYLANDPLVVDYVLNGKLPEEWKELTAREREQQKRNVTRRAAKFERIGGQLFKVKKPKARPNQIPGQTTFLPVLSKAQKDAVLKQMHDLNGHPSKDQTLALITQRYWWKGHRDEIIDYVKRCPACQFTAQPTTERSDGRTLTPTEVDRPFEMIALDLAGPLPETAAGNTYFIVAVDYYTGWTEVGALKSTASKGICDFIHREVNCRHGTPAVIVLDNDAVKGDVKTKCGEWGIQMRRIAPWAAFMNGLAEILIKNYKKGMKKLTIQFDIQWDQYIWDLCLIQRIVPKTPTGASPFELLYGRRPVLRVERLLASKYGYPMVAESPEGQEQEDLPTPIDAALEELWLHRKLNSLMRAAQQKILQDAASVRKDISQMRAITNFQRRQHRGVYRIQNLKIDQMVIMRKNKRDHNLDPGWEGPYVFRGFYDDGAQIAILEDYDGTTWPRHVTQIHPFWPRVRSQE